jgi:hypothetical protein
MGKKSPFKFNKVTIKQNIEAVKPKKKKTVRDILIEKGELEAPKPVKKGFLNWLKKIFKRK